MSFERIKENIKDELQMAVDSREGGNEGRARVCARRAAGIAIGYYYESRTGDLAPKSALNLLHWIIERDEIEPEVRQAAERLTVRVTPAHKLPHSEDPILDAQVIINSVLDEDLKMSLQQ